MTRNRIPRLLLLLVLVAVAGTAAVAIAGHDEGLPGRGFVLAAAPSDEDEEEMERHRSGVHVIRVGSGSWLGVRIDDVTDEIARELGLDRADGVRITDVEEDSPADRAGLREEDVIVGFDGERVRSHHGLRRMVRETPPGRTVELEFLRSGRRDSVQVEIQKRPRRGRAFYLGDGDEPFEVEIPDIVIPDMEIPDIDIRIPEIRRMIRLGRPRLGVHVQSLERQLGEYFGVDDGEGVLVQSVLEDSPAEKAGLRAGDVILRVDGDRIEDVGDLHRALHDSEGDSTTLTIMRDRSERELKVTLESLEEESRERHLSREEKEALRSSMRKAREAQREAMRAYRISMEELRASQHEMRSQQREMIRERQRELREARRLHRPDWVRVKRASAAVPVQI